MFRIILTLFRVLLKIPYVKNHPKILKLDKWLEKKIGIDIIKQEKKWFEKHPLLEGLLSPSKKTLTIYIRKLILSKFFDNFIESTTFMRL